MAAWFANFYFTYELLKVDNYLAELLNWFLAGILQYLFNSNVFVGVNLVCLSNAEDDSTDVTDVLQQKEGYVSKPGCFAVPPVFFSFWSVC